MLHIYLFIVFAFVQVALLKFMWEEPAFTYVGGINIKGGWYNCTEITYQDICNRYKEAGYGKVKKIGYYKSKRDNNFLILVFNDKEVR